MSGFFTRIGSLISGFRERLAGVSNTDFEIQPEPEPQQTINEAGEIEDVTIDIEAPKPLVTPSRLGLGGILSKIKRPIDIIQGATLNKPISKSEKRHSPDVLPPPESSSSRQQRRAEARSQKKIEKRNQTPEPEIETEIVFREMNFNEWMARHRIMTLYRGIVPEGCKERGDEFLLLESVREKIKTVLRDEISKKKRLRFSLFRSQNGDKQTNRR